MTSQLIEWILAVVGSGGIGAVITYFATFKSKKKLIAAEAEDAEIEVEKHKQNLHQDQYDYLQTTCDKYIKDYHELENDFRQQMIALRTELENIMKDKTLLISEKCNEIAKLKSEIAYLKGVRCYNFTCEHRMLSQDKEN